MLPAHIDLLGNLREINVRSDSRQLPFVEHDCAVFNHGSAHRVNGAANESNGMILGL